MKTSQTIEVEDDDWAMGLSDESEAEDSTERDPDWVETPISPDTPMVPRQRKSGRRTRSTETSSLSITKNPGSVKVREKNCFLSLFQNKPLAVCCSVLYIREHDESNVRVLSADS